MHALSHSLTHRGPNAGTRARSRWQPYVSSSITPTRSPASYLNTPLSSVSSSPPHLSRPIHVSQDIHRQALKSRYVACLIDQTVKSLCEIWQGQQVPPFSSIYTAQFTSALYKGSNKRSNDLFCNSRNAQLPSPISPSTHPSPPQSPYTIATVASSLSHSASPDAVPLKSFVQEVLRRSRTSGSVLQTALCYLEAVRRKIPQIALEHNVSGSHIELTSNDNEALCLQRFPSPERPLPSPLLCPRRTFLASLILASKFLQDRCYSNRAWAKLSGLSPREIGRCEKALGDALEWRLWVGKGAGKPLVRSRTEQDIPSLNVLRGTSGKTLARSQSLSCTGMEWSPCSLDQSAHDGFASSQAQSDPYQDWLAVNQSRLDEEESLPTTPCADVNYNSHLPMPDPNNLATPITPALVLSPTSTICSISSVSSFESDEGERTIQIADISEPFANKLSARYGWHNSHELKTGADVG